MAKQYGFYFNVNDCSGCKACQIACKDKNELPIGIKWRRVFEYGGGNWVQDGDFQVPSNLFAYFVSSACMHCEAAPCVDVCPTSAMTKRDDGIVYIETSKCIGCGYCGWACPYGAPQFDEEAGVMTKCNMCMDLVDQGKKPACVDGCPLRALDFGELSELRAKYGWFNDPAPLPDGGYTRPSLVVTPSRHTQSSGNATGKMLNLEEV